MITTSNIVEGVQTVRVGNHPRVFPTTEGVRCCDCGTAWRPGDRISGPCVSRDPRPTDVNPETGDAI